MTYDGRTVTLSPSVGNWQKECGSHYIIDQNRVRWARRWSAEEIADGLANDRELKQMYYGEDPAPKAESGGQAGEQSGRSKKKRNRS